MADEHRGDLVPDSVSRLRSTTAASFTDNAYAAAGAVALLDQLSSTVANSSST